MSQVTGSLHRNSTPSFIKDQDPHTKNVKRNSGSDSAFKALEKTEDDILKFAIHSLKNPSINSESNEDHIKGLSTVLQGRVTAQAAKMTGHAAEIQEKAAKIAQTQMLGKSVQVLNTRTFFGNPGEKAIFNYDIAKNIPRDASISGTITVLDENKKIVRRETIRQMQTGRNSFVWDGLTDSGKVAEEGKYSIQVSASYKQPGSLASCPVSVNTTTETKIVKIDIENWEAELEDGSVASITDITKYVDAEGSKKHSQKNIPADATKAGNYVGKTLIIKEDKVEFEGNKITKLGFNSPKDIKSAKVKVYVRQDKETISIEEAEMTLHEGRNEFHWSGLSKKAQDEGKKGIKVPYGEYEYFVEVAEFENQWEPMSPLSQVYVTATENDGLGNNMLVLEDGAIVSEKCFEGFVETKPRVSPEDLIKEASNYVGKRVLVPRILSFDGKPEGKDFNIPVIALDEEIVSLELTIMDESKNIIQTLQGVKDAMNDLRENTFKYTNLSEQGLELFEKWLAEESGINYLPKKYSDVSVMNKSFVDKHIKEQIIAGKYGIKEGPVTKLHWDGTNSSGELMKEGTYIYKYEFKTKDDDGKINTHLRDETIPQIIIGTSIQNNEIECVLEDKRIMLLSEIDTFLAG